MSTPTFSEIENAFQPAREIDSAERFAGRKDAVLETYYALVAEGANIAVVGNRGIGKSSLARQIVNMSRGDNSLLTRLALPHDRQLDFLSIYFACGNSIESIPQLLERLLTTTNCLGDWIYDIPKAKKEISSFAPEFKATLFGTGATIGGTKTTEADRERAIVAHPIDTVFTNVCHAIVEQQIAKDGLLIVVDEFDQIRDPSGAAGLLKSLATNVPRVKFCLVGVATDIHNLMKEHQSSDRLFAGSIINLPPMTEHELGEIVHIAEDSINRHITFGEDGVARLVTLAQGHPYMIHLIGKYALRSAFNDALRSIDGTLIDSTLQSIAERGADPVLEGRYKKAVASSPQREIVLRAMAAVRKFDGESWTSDAYKIAIEQDVDNPSQYVGQLVTEDFGAELEKVRERYYRFRDSLFAAYAKVRPPQFGPASKN